MVIHSLRRNSTLGLLFRCGARGDICRGSGRPRPPSFHSVRETSVEFDKLGVRNSGEGTLASSSWGPGVGNLINLNPAAQKGS